MNQKNAAHRDCKKERVHAGQSYDDSRLKIVIANASSLDRRVIEASNAAATETRLICGGAHALNESLSAQLCTEARATKLSADAARGSRG